MSDLKYASGLDLVGNSPDTRRTISFDLYGTLLDVQGPLELLLPELEPHGELLLERWRCRLVEYTLMAALMETRESFWTLARRALFDAAAYSDGFRDDGLADACLDAFRAPALPPGIVEMLEQLNEMGCRMVILSNADVAMIDAALRSSRIGSYFEAAFSAHSFGAYKPAPVAYRSIAQHFDRPPGKILHVTKDPWDAAGARRAGLRAVWARGSANMFPYGWPIDEIVNLPDLPRLILGLESGDDGADSL